MTHKGSAKKIIIKAKALYNFFRVRHKTSLKTFSVFKRIKCKIIYVGSYLNEGPFNNYSMSLYNLSCLHPGTSF